ncbi:serine/threonine protein kinase [Scheffersomyces amazonensis]|uniref:serine/threonine protein kinase n=1 Tax=Scheffersomyces amazonensis TaxID=1078765 RepID=UPI00315C99BF
MLTTRVSPVPGHHSNQPIRYHASARISPRSKVPVEEPRHTRSRKIVYNISQNFKLKEVLGQGAYGIVCLAQHTSGTLVAIKKIEPFENNLNCLRTLREIKLLSRLSGHENIINLFDVQKPLDFKNFNEVYLIQGYMPTDLDKVIRSHTLSEAHVQYFTYQLLRGIKYIHSANVIHRDLKPSNILVNEKCDLKICDFGLARLDTSKANHIQNPSTTALTEYVVTRWYRAPEIMLNACQYSVAVDLWSAGCILGEMFTYRPLFPGADYKSQLLFIFEVLGTPMGQDLNCIRSDRARDYIQTLPFKQRLDFTDLFNNHPSRRKKHLGTNISPSGIDLLERLLVFNPAYRISAAQALKHDFLHSYHDPNDEPETTPIGFEEFAFDIDKEKLSMLELKREMFHTITNLRKRAS